MLARMPCQGFRREEVNQNSTPRGTEGRVRRVLAAVRQETDEPDQAKRVDLVHHQPWTIQVPQREIQKEHQRLPVLLPASGNSCPLAVSVHRTEANRAADNRRAIRKQV